jgi:lipopolysaccharide transport system permease protein
MLTKIHYRIEPAGGWSPINIKEFWSYRDLLFHLVKRDIRSTTHSTKLGILWFLLQPMLSVAVISVVMGYFVRIDTNGVPYPLFVLSGFMLWNYFSNCITRSSNSMVANSYLLTKIYFPRIIIPIVPAISCLVELLIMMIAIVVLSAFYGILPKLSWLILISTVPAIIMLAIGCSLIMIGITSKFRDLLNALPVILQIGVYLSPIFYPLSLVPKNWVFIYSLNPVVGLVEATRAGLIGESINALSLAYSISIAIVSIVCGIYYFRVSEDDIADGV